MNFAKFLRTLFFTEHLRMTAVISQKQYEVTQCKTCQNTIFLSPVFSRIFDFVLYKKIRVRENAFFNIICAEDEYSVSPFMTVTEYELIISM